MPDSVVYDGRNLWLHLQPTRHHEKWNAFYGAVGGDEEDNGVPSGYYAEADTPVEALEELKRRFELVAGLFR